MFLFFGKMLVLRSNYMSRYEAEIVLYEPNVITNMFKENMSVKLESKIIR